MKYITIFLSFALSVFYYFTGEIDKAIFWLIFLAIDLFITDREVKS